ncbi:putative lipid-transfer protein DIR1 [Phragmites australis]|uniref:putative lipid-transfer protein DIR1 n=1 Tax=Phragmites australis TaxID=29695 RepID=UPI002D796949|nr:putative lipid-transfer protein DIR1 [Phragmites australis]
MAKAQVMGSLLTIVVVLAASAEVAHGICNLSSNGIRACQPAAAIRNPTNAPSAECCTALAGTDLQCLCRYKGAAAVWARIYGIDINRAMGLPGKCGLALPANC